ncbi:hypothetical protein [Streptomyces ochraceiscleroticus]|uniref:DUF3800 domain-containing protein n=1 Tax=Streptomyces ochraceiscleroticus TaxID=47761 RepID=A0ABW1MT80_9ACTN|nr:hypothetical protein [Streptomyces ochraceiscleroticus]
MSDTSRQPNDGTGLLGPNYARRNCSDVTKSQGHSGQWVAVDESGCDGDQLHGAPRSRYMAMGSVALSDDEAGPILDDVRQACRIQAPELKFSKMFTGPDNHRRRAVLSELLASGGVLHGRASIYLIDKHYFVVAKLIDLFIEEAAHKQGRDIRNTGRARQMARSLFTEGPRALGPALFDRLLATTVAFTAHRNRDQKVTVDDFYDVVEEAWARSYRRKVTETLELLRATRREAHEYLDDAHGPDAAIPQALEPLIPAVAAITGNWSRRLGRVNMLIDDQRALTDANFDLIEQDARDRGPLEFRYLSRGVHLGNLLRGQSKDHPSLQLADLLSGAGFAVAMRHDGVANPAGDDLWPVVVPLIDPQGMLPHDEPEKVAQPPVTSASRRA